MAAHGRPLGDGDDADPLELPADTLQALQEFQAEQSDREKRFEDLKAEAEGRFADGDGQPLSMDLFSEDWNASQFWYDDGTARVLAKQLLRGTTDHSAIAVVSAPSVFVALRNMIHDAPSGPRPRIVLLEFDRRFDVFGHDFLHYDFMAPLRLPIDLKARFDRIVCDPPFLSEDCQTKSALTVRFLAKAWDPAGLKLITCTGERMLPVIRRLYRTAGVGATDFEPRHRNGLSNEFRCYANFDCDDWRRATEQE